MEIKWEEEVIKAAKKALVKGTMFEFITRKENNRRYWWINEIEKRRIEGKAEIID